MPASVAPSMFQAIPRMPGYHIQFKHPCLSVTPPTRHARHAALTPIYFLAALAALPLPCLPPAACRSGGGTRRPGLPTSTSITCRYTARQPAAKRQYL